MTNVCGFKAGSGQLLLIAVLLCVGAGVVHADGTFVYATYLGGDGKDYGYGVAADAFGNVYVAGYTESTNYPTTNAINPSKSGFTDAVVSKLNSAGDELLLSTHLGGSVTECAYAIAVDPAGNIYVAGTTTSSDYPTTNAFQSSSGGASDGFVTKLSPDGQEILFSTFLGGNGADVARGIAVDPAGNVYVTGYTTSTNFPTTNAFQSAGGVTNDVFVAKLDPTGSNLLYSTYLGGGGHDYAYRIAVDTEGYACIVGRTGSTNDFPTTNAFQAVHGGGQYDAFVAKFAPAGSNLAFCTFLGGSGTEYGYGIDVDDENNIYAAGTTYSSDFPVTNAHKPYGPSQRDAFLTKLVPDGTSLVYSTFIGTSETDEGYGVTVDSSRQAHVVMRSYLVGWISFVKKYDAAGTNLLYSMQWGNGADIYPNDIASDPYGNVYVSGVTVANDFGTPDAFQPTYMGGYFDAWAVKIAGESNVVDVSVTKEDSPGLQIHSNLTYTITVVNHGPSNATDVTVSDPLPSGPTFVSAASSQGTCTQEGGTVTAELGALERGSNATVTVVVTPLVSGVLTNRATVTVSEPDHNPCNDEGVRASEIPFDADVDGMGDEWEWSNFNVLTNAADGDNDGDSYSNYRECVAGTQPTNAGSLCVIYCTNVVADTNVEITVMTEPGRTYTIRYADDEAGSGGTWSTFANTNDGVGAWVETGVVESAFTFVDDKGTNTTDGDPSSGHRYYQVEVRAE